jgi:hypothetical protein
MPLPIDIRNATWDEVLTHVSDDMLRVHRAWQEFGPGTTRQVAERAGISLLTLRPRTTELYQLGLVECVGEEKANGIYEYRSEAQAEASKAWREDRKSHRQRNGRGAPAGEPQFTSMEQKVRWAASIMGQHARQKRRRVVPTIGTQLDLLPA